MKKLMMACVAAYAAGLSVQAGESITISESEGWSAVRAAAADAKYSEIVLGDGTFYVDEPVAKLSATMRSVNGPAATIVDGRGNHLDGDDTFKTNAIADGAANVLLSGITFQNCEHYGQGGAVFLRRSVVSNCVFRNCRALSYGANSHSGTSDGIGNRAMGGGLMLQGLDNWASAQVYGTHFVNCVAEDLKGDSFAGKNDNAPAGGGLYFSAYNPGSIVSGCTFSNCAARAVGWAGNFGDGGGAVFNCSALILTNCVFFGNTAGGRCGGFKKSYGINQYFILADTQVASNTAYMVGGCWIDTNGTTEGNRVYGCSFIGNLTTETGKDEWSGPYGCALYCKQGATVEGCLFEDNILTLAYMYDGGAACSLSANSSFANCIFRGNRQGVDGHQSHELVAGAAICLDGGTKLGVKSCVFEDNWSHSSGAAIGANSGGGNVAMTIEDCIFTGNIAANDKYGVIRSANADTRVRNCYFAKNMGKSLDIKNGRMENVTAVDNIVTNSQWGWTFDDPSIMYNCVAVRNRRWWNGQFDAGEYNINSSKTIPAENKVIKVESVGMFVDPDNGDFRPKARSGLRDVANLYEWMEDAKDLGDGTYTETYADPVRKTGLKLAFNNRRPRIWGNGPDIGCFEYYHAPGLMLLFW